MGRPSSLGDYAWPLKSLADLTAERRCVTKEPRAERDRPSGTLCDPAATLFNSKLAPPLAVPMAPDSLSLLSDLSSLRSSPVLESGRVSSHQRRVGGGQAFSQLVILLLLRPLGHFRGGFSVGQGALAGKVRERWLTFRAFPVGQCLLIHYL